MDQRKVLTSSCSFLRPGITQASLVVLYTWPLLLVDSNILALTKLSLLVTAHCGQQNCECAAAACNNRASSKPSHRSRRALSWQGAEHWSETKDLLPKPTLDVDEDTGRASKPGLKYIERLSASTNLLMILGPKFKPWQFFTPDVGMFGPILVPSNGASVPVTFQNWFLE